MPYEDLRMSRLDPGMMKAAFPFADALPYELCRKELLAPLYVDGDVLILACAGAEWFLRRRNDLC